MLRVPELLDVDLPHELTLKAVERNSIGETNVVFACQATLNGRPVDVFLKISRGSAGNLAHERDVLARLAASGIPVPRVLGYVGSPKEVLILEAMPGSLIWDHIDPRRRFYDRTKVASLLRVYGECLARIHGLPAEGPPHRRDRLYELIGEEEIPEPRFERVVSWLQPNAPKTRPLTFVHGDLNTGSVLVHEGQVSGVLDWEFAGVGWREYDLAWLLRARISFLNTEEERKAVLQGYGQAASYEPESLRYCEVLNYLHFARWCGTTEPQYAEFALDRADALV